MTMTLTELVAIYPEQLWLEFSIAEREQAWARSQEQSYSNPSARWRAFINSLCLDVFGKWLQEYTSECLPDSSEVTPTQAVWLENGEEADTGVFSVVSPDLSWEFVNGTEVALGETKLVLIPSDESNLKEFRVPREWVDIPSWAGKYYLAVQLNLEENWLRVWGYTTHQSLREGRYDLSDGTYSLDREDLIEDLTVMFVTQALYPDCKPTVETLPILSQREAQKWLNCLGKATLYSPRLEIPFPQWAALLENEEWRRDLCRRRWNRESVKPVFPLSQWFQIERACQTLQSTGWQLAQEIFGQEFAYRNRTSLVRESNVSWVKRIDGEIQTPSPIALVMNLSCDAEGTIWIGPQLRSVNPIVKLPEGIKLMILDSEGTVFTTIQASRADNLIQIQQFSAAMGESFSIQVEEGDSSFIQQFTI